MRSWLRGLFVLIGISVPALAQEAANQPFYIWTALGYQQITPVPAATTLTIPPGVAGGTSARMAIICVETNSVRYRDDGTAPTATVGMLIEPAGTSNPGCIKYEGPLSALIFQQVTSPATIDVSYYR